MKNFKVFGHRTFLLNNRIIFKVLQHNIAQHRIFFARLFGYRVVLWVVHHVFSTTFVGCACSIMLTPCFVSWVYQCWDTMKRFRVNFCLTLCHRLKVFFLNFFFTPWSISRPLLSNHFSATIDGITSDADPPDALTSIVSCSNV